MRIRAGTHGILEANRSIIILATTSAVGPAATAVYRSIGMSGVLPKPVRAADLASFLGTLIQAPNPRLVARGDGAMVRAGQEPNSACLFFLPPDDRTSTPATPPDVCDGRDFVAAIREQTRASLRQAGGLSRSISNSDISSLRVRAALGPGRSGSVSSAGSCEELPPYAGSHDNSGDHVRGNSVSISSSVLRHQLAHEVAQMHALDSPTEQTDSSDKPDSQAQALSPAPTSFDAGIVSPVALEATGMKLPKALTAPPTPSIPLRRPLAHKRASSPAWLAHWDSLIELPESLIEEEEDFLGESLDLSKLRLGSTSSSAPTSPLALPAGLVAAPASPELSRRSIATSASEEGSDSGSGMGSVPTSSRSTAKSTFSPRTPSEALGSSPSYFPNFTREVHVHRTDYSHGEPLTKRSRESVCTMDTSAGTSLASSPSVEAPPSLLDTGTRASAGKPLSTLVLPSAPHTAATL